MSLNMNYIRLFFINQHFLNLLKIPKLHIIQNVIIQYLYFKIEKLKLKIFKNMRIKYFYFKIKIKKYELFEN